jgi:hypothetical protein
MYTKNIQKYRSKYLHYVKQSFSSNSADVFDNQMLFFPANNNVFDNNFNP